MGLPTSIGFLDSDGREQRAELKKASADTGYAPDAEYHPTHVVVKCRRCGSVGVAEFEGGFDLRKGDRLMEGKPVSGHCFRCARETELVPLNPDHPDNTPELRHLFNIRKALEEAARRGERFGPSSVVWPLERVKAYERFLERRG